MSARYGSEQAVKLLEEILKIYSPPLQETPLALFLREKMEGELGLSNVRLDEARNVRGEIGSGRPAVLLCGHMDTVPGKQPVRLVDGRLYGRGASDAKGALASMLVAASRLADREGIGRITVVGVTDEEGSGTGIRELIRSGIDADYAIFGEPSGVENITIGYKGRVALKISCRTTSVHASAPWMSENAVERGYQVWQSINAELAKESNPGNRYGSLSACLTQMRGGTAHNVTPGECEITVDVRIPPQLSCSQVISRLQNIVEEFQRDISFPKLEVEVTDMTEPYEVQKNSPLIRSLVKAILQVRKRRPMLVKKTGTGDMNVLGHALKIPLVTYGPGHPHLSHTRNEFIEVSEYLAGIDVCEQALLNLSRNADGRM